MQLAISAAGAGLGYWLGPSLGLAAGTGARWGWMIGGAVGAQFAEGPTTEGPRLDDLSTPFSTYDKPIPIVYGDARLDGNVIWSQPLREVREEEEQGGKGGPTATTVSYSYFGTWATAFCEGDRTVKKIWFDTKLVYDATDPGAIVNPYPNQIKIYTGSETQDPDATIEGYEGAGNVPAYRGITYVVFDDLPVADYGNRIPKVSALIGPENAPCSSHAIKDSPAATSPLGQMMIKTAPHVIGNSTQYMRWGTGTIQIFDISGQQDFIAIETPIDHGNTSADNDGEYVYSGGTSSAWDIAKTNLHTGELVESYNIGKNPGGSIVGNEWLCFADNFALKDTYLFMPKDDLSFRKTVTLTNGYFHPQCPCMDTDDNMWMITVDSATQMTLYRITPIYGISNPTFSIRSWAFTDASWNLETGGSGYVLRYCRSIDAILMWAHVDVADISTTPVYYRFDIDGDDVTLGGTLHRDGSWPLEYRDGEQGKITRGLRNYDGGEVTYLLGTSSSQRMIKVDLLTMTPLESEASDDCDLPAASFLWAFYHEPGDMLVISKYLSGEYGKYLHKQSLSPITLPTLVGNISEVGGLDSADYDTTGLDSVSIDGYVLGSQRPLSSYLGHLSQVFQFHAVDSDWKIKYRSLDPTTAASIPASDLRASNNTKDTGHLISEKFLIEEELPQAVDVVYYDKEFDYQRNTIPAKRMDDTVNARDIKKIDFGMAISKDLAAQQADKILQLSWSQRSTYDFSIPFKYMGVDAGDSVQVTDDNGAVHTMYLSEVTVRPDFVLQCTGLSNTVTGYDSDMSGDVSGGYTSPSLITVAPVYAYYMDIPALRDEETDKAYLHISADTYDSNNWRGAVLQRKDSDGIYSDVEVLRNDGTMGSAITALGDCTYTGTWDYANTLQISLNAGDSLSSAAEIDVLNGANVLLVGDEIIQFVNVTDDGNNKYTVSKLLRARRGTDAVAHSAGERVVLLNTTSVYRDSVSNDLIDSTVTYRTVPLGGATLLTYDHDISFTGATLKPYSPVYVEAEKDASSPQNLDITWIRRTRIGGGWNSGADVPLGEDSESYEIDILTTGDVLKRTLTATSESVTYDRADQITDFGSGQTNIHIKVYQMSATVGRGFASETLTASIG